jgi:4-hydroxybenzoate polyprenyltransferase
MSRAMAYLELIKFRYHVTFLTVVFAALIFAPLIEESLFRSLAGLYVSFNVLFYGGIYTLNDLRDLKSDRQHARKRNRPLPSGRVPVRNARYFAAVLIAAGLISARIFFGPRIFTVYVVVLGLNLLYSFFARNVAYLDIAVNTATHPLRFLLGVLLTGRGVPLLHLVAYFFFVFGLSCLRRELEKDVPGWEARPTLKLYSHEKLRALELLSLLLVLCCLWADGFVSKGFYLVITPAYLFLVLGARWSSPLRSLLHAIWTR